MGLFGKSAQQKRIDELVHQNRTYLAEIAASGVELTANIQELANIRRQLRTQLAHAEAERDAARIERDTAQRERDGYRIDALKHRANVKHLIPGGPKAKAKRDAARGVQELRA